MKRSPRLAVFGEARRLTHARRKVLVAEAAAAALRRDDARAGLVQIREKLFRALGRAPKDDGTHGNGDGQVVAAAAGLV